MNGIGNAFIWASIACGPVLLIFLGIVAAEKRFIAARRHALVRIAARRSKTIRDRNITDKQPG
jgi:hypothetical protein